MGRAHLAAAATAAALLLVPATTHAATVSGRIVGEPKVTKRSVTLPVAAPGVTKVVVARTQLRGRYTRMTPTSLRLGDRFRARRTGPVRKGRARATRVVITARGPAPTFGQLAAQRAAALGTISRAREVLPTAENPNPQGGEPAEQRRRILAVRYDLNVLVESLRLQAEAIGALLPVVAEAPRTAGALRATRSDMDGVRHTLETTVTALDEALIAVGGTSPPPLPVETGSLVGAALNDAVEAIGRLPVIGTP